MSEARLPIHPYAAIFPVVTAIAWQGLLEEIILHEGKVLDGWHRYLACLIKQVPPRLRDYAGECGSALHFVLAKNIDRRHLTPGQRALVAARLKPLLEEEARQRQRAPLKQGTQFPVGENSPQREKGRSAQKAAELMKDSDFSVKAADQVKKRGVPQLVDALAAGRGSVSAAARIAGLPPEQQQAVVAGIDL